MIYVISAMVVGALAFFLTFHCEYEDGIVGRFALGGLWVIEFSVVYEWLVEGVPNDVLPSTVGINVCFALFLTRHVYRFLIRANGRNDWKPARK
jgi:hypothetical protein